MTDTHGRETPATLENIAARQDHQDELLHRVLALVEPLAEFIETNRHLLERGARLLDPLGLRAGRKAGRHG